MCTTLSGALMVIAGIVGASGFWCHHKGALFHSGFMFFAAGNRSRLEPSRCP